MNTHPGTALSCITGLGFSALSREPVGTVRSLAAEAVSHAIIDAGLQAHEVDGLLLNQSAVAAPGSLPLGVHADIGLSQLNLLSLVEGKGSSVVQMVQQATMAIQAGMATHVACVFADTPIAVGKGGGAAFNNESALTGIEGWEAHYGLYGPVGAYAMGLRRYMHAFGLTERDLGAYAVVCRQWAERNPMTVRHRPLTIKAYLESRYIAEPMRLFDCAYPVNGGAAVIVSRVSDALAALKPPVYVHGMGQGHAAVSRVRGADAHEDEFATAGALAAARAYAMAGIGPGDIGMCQFYDAFSWNVTVALEDYGLCGRGEGMRFIADGHTAPGGRLPVNTGGGQLASYYLQGMTPLAEAVIQLRGDGGERQVAGVDVVLVNGSGGTLEHHGALVLSRCAALNAASRR